MLSKLIITKDPIKRSQHITQLLSIHIPDGNLKNPDLLYFPQDEKLGVAAAKKIIEHFSTKPYSLPGKIVVVEESSNLTMDAQNSLLKTLEEPPNQAQIILATSNEDKLLPTILSRCELIYLDNVVTEKSLEETNPQSASEDINNLIALPMEERFTYVEKLKDKEVLLNSLLKHFRAKLLQEPTSKTVREYLNELLKAEEYFKSNVNQRAILEYLMLSLPK
jgi:hypothetical protein